jgi:hypothetical protein
MWHTAYAPTQNVICTIASASKQTGATIKCRVLYKLPFKLFNSYLTNNSSDRQQLQNTHFKDGENGK